MFCKEVLVAICFIWNVVHCKQISLPMVFLRTLFNSIHLKLLFFILFPDFLRGYIKVSPRAASLKLFKGGC